MSATPDAQPQGTSSHRLPAKSLSLRTRVNRALFSTQRWPWVFVDLVTVLAMYELGFKLSPYGGYRDIISPYVAMSVVFALAFITVSLGLGSYDRAQRFQTSLILRNALLATLLASLINLAFHYFTLYEVVGRLSLVYGAGFAFVGTTLLRAALTMSVREHPYRFTVIGTPGSISEILALIRSGAGPRLHFLVPWDAIFADPQHPTVDELVQANIAEIVLADQVMGEQQAIEYALIFIQANVPVVEEWSFYARHFERLPVTDVSKRWILERGLARPQGVVVAAKRTADIVLGLVAMVVAIPMMAVIAAAIRLDSRGPVIFVQRRQGRFFVPFWMYKFRTMRWQGSSDGSTGFTQASDARVTRVGRFLRRLHLDELPQLVNILRGDMSLVGPRPETVEFANRMDVELPLYELRYLVRPGLTGHAQLMHGYAMDTADDTQMKLAYDLYYLCSYSMRLDLQILLRTAFFLAKGAR